MTKDQLNALYDADDELIAYIIYPDGPSCAIYDRLSSVNANQLRESMDVAKDYYWWMDDFMYDAGYNTSETSSACINGFYFVVNIATYSNIATSSYYTYYENAEGDTRVIEFDFNNFDDRPVWRTYVERYMNMVAFKPGSVEFGSIVYNAV